MKMQITGLKQSWGWQKQEFNGTKGFV